MPVKNICDCHNPPGGRAVCEPHQMAFCVVINGVARRECLDPPRAESATLARWALSHVLGYRYTGTIDSYDLQVLTHGVFERADGAIVTFTLPEFVKRAVQSLIAEIEEEGEGEAAAGAW